MKCEICNKPAHHRHHIISKAFGGTNAPYNITTICASHHADIHNGEIIVEGRFLTSDGYVLFWHYKNESSITGMESDLVYLNRSV